MQHLTIQLSFNFHHTESGLLEAIDLLDFTIYNGLALNSLQAYNQIFLAIQYCKNNEILPRSSISRLFGRLTASQTKMYSLLKVD